MHPLGKILIGLILMVGSAAAVYYSHPAWGGTPYPILGDLWESFKIVVGGMLPPFVFLIGLFIVWLEWDEWRIERELKAEEEREKRRRKEKR